MRRIIAIGGGEIKYNETLEIDKKIVEAAGKKSPRLLFIPTASDDATGYIEDVKLLFGEKLGCQVSAIKLIESGLSEEEIRQQILNVDIIYVGGGNTRKMMDIWKSKKVDIALKEAHDKGLVLSGLSAGSICWFEQGQSDSDTYEIGKKQPYSIVKGLGIIPFFHCPHHNKDQRMEKFPLMMEDSEFIGFALDNCCAIDIKDDTYRIIKAKQVSEKDQAKAYLVYKNQKQIVYRELEELEEYKNLDELLLPLAEEKAEKEFYKVFVSRASSVDNPIELIKGDLVRVSEESNPLGEWPNWMYSRKNRDEKADKEVNTEAWVPKQILKNITGDLYEVQETYNSIELDVDQNEVLVKVKAVNNWIWCYKKTDPKVIGWVPLNCLVKYE